MRYLPLLLLLALAGCASNTKSRSNFGYGGGRVDPHPVYDTIPLHPTVEVGQYWQTTSWNDDGERLVSIRWCISRKIGNCFIVEEQLENWIEPEYAEATITAYLVDPTPHNGQVLRAWRGHRGYRPREIEVLPYGGPSSSLDALVALGRASIPAERSFVREVSGRVLYGDQSLYVLIAEDGNKEGEIRISRASNGWFDKLVENRTTYNGNQSKTELTDVGTDGKSWLSWKGVDVRPGYRLLEDGRVVKR